MATSNLDSGPQIVDLREQGLQPPLVALRAQIIAGLSKPPHQRTLPTELLYDERGLQLLDELTTNSKTYVAFKAEEQILRDNSAEIVKAMGVGPGEAIVFELGAGSLEKTRHLLRALANAAEVQPVPPVTFYALDMEYFELARTLREVSSSLGEHLAGKVQVRGVCSTFDGGLEFIRNGGLIGIDGCSRAGYPPLHFLFLGATIGNFLRPDAVEFLRSLPLRTGDTLLMGIDHRADGPTMVSRYNDPDGYARRFSLNGLNAVERALRTDELKPAAAESKIFEADGWEFHGQWDEVAGCHEGCYRSTRDQELRIPRLGTPLHFEKDELIKYELSHKFSDVETDALFAASDLRVLKRWTDIERTYSVWLLRRSLD